MGKKYTEYKGLNLPKLGEEVGEFWKEHSIFDKSISSREENKPFVFFEGPPSANGMPGIHHAMARSIKDIFCRYKTLKGYRVNRKAGGDTHGLPVELGVEKEMGITKEDIGVKISIDEYNQACRESVMRYTDKWNELTEKMGYWVDLEDPYITYENKYMETVWWLLKQIHQKDLMYKGYTIQPYSPAAGTGLSSHEVNLPGCYKDVKDTTIVAQFKVLSNEFNQKWGISGDVHFLAWTTTPWTLPSNTALCVGPKIEYSLVKSFNQYTGEPIQVIIGSPLVGKQFSGKYFAVSTEEEVFYKEGDKKIPYYVVKTFKGIDLVGIKYEQLIKSCLPYYDAEKAFQVIQGDFVTTEDGTGIVHIAPTFGADDAAVAKEAGVPPMLILDSNQNPVPLVDLTGRFVEQMGGDLGGMFVKNEYYNEAERPEKGVDVLIAIDLKTNNKAFKVEKYEHTYPHCWRTDKPVLYYPLDSWFIRATSVKARMSELNKTINWKPESTGTGRFGNWLENANDWNLSRSRYWGIPIPIWSNEDGEIKVIGSAEELKEECQKAVEAGLMKINPLADFVVGDMSKENYNTFDLHKNYVDAITLVSDSGKALTREPDLIDVWFDSGAMPYAQWHYPFENKELIDNNKAFPADFIAEGVDQTRGWFYTLHAIATMCFDSVAYKNVVSNGLVLDKEGQKMSKRLGNAIDPFETLSKYGPDATRWYMMSNSQPWDNLKFDIDGIAEVQRKFFGTMYNTYQFFGLYANLDGFDYSQEEIELGKRPEIDRWILSKLNSLIKVVDDAYADYEPTKACRAIQDFVSEQLSNWYVRLCRRRFWKGDYSEDKISAYQTLYRCLETVAQLSAPVAPFFMDRLFKDLDTITGRHQVESVHLSNFPVVNEEEIDIDLEERMDIAQKHSSLILGLRKKNKLKVRQPLQKIMVPILNEKFERQIEAVKDLILSEVNVKELEYLKEDSGVLVKKVKANFKLLGKKYGKQMKAVAAAIAQFDQATISTIEREGKIALNIEGNPEILLEEVEISTEDIPGLLVASEGKYTVALDITLTEELKQEGIARELVNRIQNLRKEKDFDLTDNINLMIKSVSGIDAVISNYKEYICTEVLAKEVQILEVVDNALEVEVDENMTTEIAIEKV
ncbi:MAG: isoleucine--tRNA ligase [Flavobacteriales bacterium]|nr:isoleucine--tRNA ligase [Flavobacteriales bacterium]